VACTSEANFEISPFEKKPKNHLIWNEATKLLLRLFIEKSSDPREKINSSPPSNLVE
jgi:hypothetical protein